MQKNKKAFTLVELIVAITILAILGTIAFMSFQGYSKSARDSVRISDLKNIEKGLEIMVQKSGRVPLPDDKVDITASGAVISYQGYVGEDVLSSIGVHNGGKDPLDQEYYTYAINSNFKKYQVLGFLEDSYLSSKSIIGLATANLKERIPFTRGNIVGILLDNLTNSPLQETGTGFEVINNSNEIKVVFDSDNTLTGTGEVLKSMQHGGNFAYKLLGYWDFNQGSGNIVKDLSGNGNDGFLSGSIMPVWTGSLNGGGIYFQSGFVEVPNLSNQFMDEDNDLSINLIFDFDKLKAVNKQKIISITESGGYNIALNHDYSPVFDCTILGSLETLCLLIHNGSKYETLPYLLSDIQDGLINMAITYEKDMARLYINGVKIAEKRLITKINYRQGVPLCIGAETWINRCEGEYFHGLIDEVRIYNRKLSDYEIKDLYNLMN